MQAVTGRGNLPGRALCRAAGKGQAVVLRLAGVERSGQIYLVGSSSRRARWMMWS